MNWARHISFSLLLAVGCISCTKEKAPDCIKALGDIKTEVRGLSSFNRLEIQGRIDLNLVQDSSDWAEVTFGEALTTDIITDLNEGTLKIHEEISCEWIRDQQVIPLVTVHYKSLRNIYNESAGTIAFTNSHTSGRLVFEVYDVSGKVLINFSGDSIDIISHTGSTDISVQGSANVGYFYSSSYAPIRAQNLFTKVAIPHSESTGDIELRASEAVYYQLFNWGNIIIHGNPGLVKKWHHDGTGEVILKEN